MSGKIGDQWVGIQAIPSRVFANWPAFFSFGLVNYVTSMIIDAVPNLGGYAGLVERAAIGGARDVITMVTWESIRNK